MKAKLRVKNPTEERRRRRLVEEGDDAKGRRPVLRRQGQGGQYHSSLGLALFITLYTLLFIYLTENLIRETAYEYKKSEGDSTVHKPVIYSFLTAF